MMRNRTATNASQRRHDRHGNLLLAASLVVFGLFAANVLVGKAEIAYSWRSPLHLSDVVEFLLLLAAALLFTLAALARERSRDAAGGQGDPITND